MQWLLIIIVNELHKCAEFESIHLGDGRVAVTKTTTLYVMVFWASEGLLRIPGLSFFLFFPPSSNTASSSSRSVSGLQGSPPPSLRWSRDTHEPGHACKLNSRAHLAEGLAFIVFTHIFVLRALPVFVQSDSNAVTISFYLSYISQLYFYQQQLFFSPTLNLHLERL